MCPQNAQVRIMPPLYRWCCLHVRRTLIRFCHSNVCENCVETRPRCDICKVPVAVEVARLAGGRYRCSSCLADMVSDEMSTQRVFKKAAQHFRVLMGDALQHEPRLIVADATKMADIRRQMDQSPPGNDNPVHVNYHALGCYVRTRDRGRIYVERDLPHGLLLGTIAHELAHAWHAEQAPGQRDRFICEGFAEWVAYHVLTSSGQRRIALRTLHREDIYGLGLRHFLQIERRGGKAAVLSTARAVTRT